MRKILNNEFIQLAVRLIIGFIFVFAAIGKIAEPQLFIKDINNYRIVWEPLLNIMALILPWLELLVGIFLIIGFRLKSSSFIAGFLMMIFIIAVSIAMIQGLSINCGCFAKNMAEKVGWSKLIENTSTLILCFYTFMYPNQRLTLEIFVSKNSDNFKNSDGQKNIHIQSDSEIITENQ